MKTIHRHTDKEKFWRAQMTAAERFPGSQQAFCRSQGLSLNTFQYWRKKFNQEKRSPYTPVIKTSPFIEVEVIRPIDSPRRVPEAKWVAELILHLQGSIR